MASPLRIIDVHPPSPRRELAGVLLAILAVLATGYRLVRASPSTRSPGDGPALASWQRPLSSLAGSSARVVRDLVASVDEVGRLEAARSDWPDPGTLAGEFVPPFDGDPGIAWRLDGYGPAASYLGIPRLPGAPGWLLDVQKGLPPSRDPSHLQVPGPGHRVLVDGSIYHYRIWLREDPPPEFGFPGQPAIEGWLEILPDLPGSSS